MRHSLIIGGTGTLGKALIKRIGEEFCTVLSRDEFKQKKLKEEFPNIETVLGDVRDKKTLVDPMRGVTKVYHLAALKHVDILEKHPQEAFKTNYQGVVNSFEQAIESKVSDFYFTSTDKAVLPINSYGMSKSMAERYLINASNNKIGPDIYIFRWGNILGSRGSVLSYFLKTLLEENIAFVTDHRMSRFWLKIEDVANFLVDKESLDHLVTKENIFIPNCKSSLVIDLVAAIAKCINLESYKIYDTGIRPGEKIDECLSQEYGSPFRSSKNKFMYSVSELVDFIQPLIKDMM